MITILIKSFNRPYYLDRCLKSIKRNVSGNYKVIVLDDGTPEKYLQKIKKLHPTIEIRTSLQYDEKINSIQKNIESGTEINGFQIPTKLWYDSVKNSNEYVLVTEDDVWFSQPINLSDLENDISTHDISLLKLGWLGNQIDDKDLEINPINDRISKVIPLHLFTGNQFVMDCFMYNRFKFFTVLYKLGVVNNGTRRKYYALNSIAMGIYEKKYWLHIWKDSRDKVDEKQQLRNAAAYYHKNKNPNFIARTKTEVLKTTFQSSATNSYHQYNIDFDVNYFNHLINKAWLEGKFDVMQNFPKDFSIDYFTVFLDSTIKTEEFTKWVDRFKEQYRNLGATVDD